MIENSEIFKVIAFWPSRHILQVAIKFVEALHFAPKT